MNDLRQGVTPAGHDVFDRIDNTRASLDCVEVEDLFRMACKSADATRGGDLFSRRRAAVIGASLLVIAAERIDREIDG